MRNGHRNGYAAINYGVVNYTNYIQTTNVTNVTMVQSAGDMGSRRRKHARRELQGRERKPELLRFCGSCGILDQDKVMRMSDEQIVDGVFDVGRYVSRDVATNVEGICGGLSTMGHGVAGVVHGLFSAVRAILR